MRIELSYFEWHEFNVENSGTPSTFKGKVENTIPLFWQPQVLPHPFLLRGLGVWVLLLSWLAYSCSSNPIVVDPYFFQVMLVFDSMHGNSAAWLLQVLDKPFGNQYSATKLGDEIDGKGSHWYWIFWALHIKLIKYCYRPSQSRNAMKLHCWKYDILPPILPHDNEDRWFLLWAENLWAFISFY